MNWVFAALAILVSFAYLHTFSDLALLAIPLLSLVWWRMGGSNVPLFLALFSAFYLLLSAISLFAGMNQHILFGGPAYVYFASAALVSVLQYLVEKNDS